MRRAPYGQPGYYRSYALHVAACIAAQMSSSAGSTTSPLLDGLVAYWTLNEASGTRFDSVGSNDLTDNGGVGSAPGVQGNAASFDTTTGQYLQSPAITTIGLAWTLAFWIQPQDTTTQMTIMDSVDGLAPRLFIERTPENRLRVVLPGGNQTGTTAIGTTWRHLCFVSDGTSLRVLIDTTEEFTIASTADNAGFENGATFGELVINNTRQFIGDIDEVGIWSRVLTSGEISDLYNGGAGITYPFV